MKKITLFLLLLSTLFADARPYIGTHAGVYTESFSDIEATSSSPMANIKIGYGNRTSYAVEFSLDYLKSDAQIFSATGKDGDKMGFNVNLIKSFDFGIYILPFVKVGFGSGVQKINRKLQDALSYGAFEMALGTYIPMGRHFDMELGYEVSHLSYESIDLGATKPSYGSAINTLYLGINYRY